jgi:hypothetical protein
MYCDVVRFSCIVMLLDFTCLMCCDVVRFCMSCVVRFCIVTLLDFLYCDVVRFFVL